MKSDEILIKTFDQVKNDNFDQVKFDQVIVCPKKHQNKQKHLKHFSNYYDSLTTLLRSLL
jgi:hypothetical protein